LQLTIAEFFFLTIKNLDMSSTQLDDLYDEQSDKHIAKLLGITVDEYNQLEHGGIQEDASDEGLVYRYYIESKNTSPRQILKKIKGLDSNNTFYFEPGSFVD
jgi:hypothetical protein